MKSVNEYNLDIINKELKERRLKERDYASASLMGCSVANYKAFRMNRLTEAILIFDFFILFFLIGYLLGLSL